VRMSKIRVLLVDDNDDTRDGTRRLLEYEDDIEIVDFADNGLVAIDKVKEHAPDVVLMDINMPVMDGLTATQRLQNEVPRTQIIIVSVQDDPNYMREAMQAGAVDFVAKPISGEELAESIRRAYRKRPAPAPAASQQPAGPAAPVGYETGHRTRSGSVITILGPKGGIGKTTIAVNLGIGIARSAQDKRVIIVDGNVFFGDVGVFINTRGQYSVVDMALMAEVPEEIDQVSVDQIIVGHESGVKLLVAPPNPGETGGINSKNMLNMLEYLRTQFDYIIVDTAAYFDDVLVASIQAADRLIMISQPLMPALKDTRVMFGELSAAAYSMDDVMLILNKVPRDSRITTEQIANFLRHPVQLEIPFDTAADEAVNRGVALITLDARRVNAVKPLTDLVQLVREWIEAEVSENDEGLAEQNQQRGLFGFR
jgi:pilus assembly protein CpaE